MLYKLCITAKMLAMLNQRLLQDSFVILDFNATPTGLTDSHVSTSHVTKTHLTAFSYVIRHLNPAYADLISLPHSSPHNSNLHIFANKGAPFFDAPDPQQKKRVRESMCLPKLVCKLACHCDSFHTARIFRCHQRRGRCRKKKAVGS